MFKCHVISCYILSFYLFSCISHTFCFKGINFDPSKSGGLHDKHAVATWKLRNILSISLKTAGTQEKLSRWPMAGPSGCVLTCSQQSGRHKLKLPLTLP